MKSFKKLVFLTIVLISSLICELKGEEILSEGFLSERLQNITDEPSIKSLIFGEGTYFEITESEYLKVSLASSKEI